MSEPDYNDDLFFPPTSTLQNEVYLLRKKLEIATKALKNYAERNNWDKEGVSFGKYTKGWILAEKALKQIASIKGD